MRPQNYKIYGTFTFQNNLGILLPFQKKLAWDGVNFNPYFSRVKTETQISQITKDFYFSVLVFKVSSIVPKL
jgi:hypothetical protein